MKLIIEEIKPDELDFITESHHGQKFHYITGPFMRSEIVNGNGRMYPLGIMEREVEKYNKNYIKEGRAFGELGHPDCFTEGVEALTENGWKELKDINVGDNVYTLNPETHDVVIQSVVATTNKPYEGKVFNIKNRTFDVTVTPTHRFPVIDRKNKLEMIFAKDMTTVDNHSFIPRTHKGISKETPEYFKVSENLNIDFKIFCAFMGIYLSEGSTTKRKDRPNSYKIAIYQNVGSKADEFQKIFDQLPFEVKRYERRNGIGIIWHIHNIELAEYLFQFGKAHEKYVDKQLINQMNFECAEIFLNYFVMGDGRGTRNTKLIKSDAFSTSEHLIDDISHITFIAGFASRKHSTNTIKDYVFADRVIDDRNKKPLFFNYFLNSKGIYTDSRFLQIEEQDYSGNIYCLTVPNGIFYARSKGYTFWTGNSPKINLERTSHLIVSLVREGKDFIGKARVMDTPYGKIVQNILEAGGKLGVSSRGLGSLREQNGINVVQDDFELRTAADVVADPSAPDAFVTGLMENVEWIKDEKLGWKALEKAEDYKKYVHKEYKRIDEEKKLNMFKSFLNNL